MTRFTALSAALLLPLCACQVADPEAPASAQPIDLIPPSATSPSSYELYSKFVWSLNIFHSCPHCSEDALIKANASKTSPTDTIELLPPGLQPPSGVTLEWAYVNEMVIHPLDPSKPLRVPLRDGIAIVVRSDDVSQPAELRHSATSSLQPPELSLAGGSFDYLTDSIEITTSRPGATIRYSLDGSYPDLEGTTYQFQKKIPLDRSLFLRAYAELPGSVRSTSTVAIYTVADGRGPGVVYVTLLDKRDGQVYPTVRLGNRTWMAKNLNWNAGASNPRSPLFGTRYSAAQVQAVGTSAICPDNWHPSTKADWDSLVAWGTRQPGVTPRNLANALQSNVLRRGPSNPNSTQLADSNFVDLFGFRGTTSDFATSTPGADSSKFFQVHFDDEAVEFPITPAIYDGYGIREDGTAGPMKVTSYNYVRCVMD